MSRFLTRSKFGLPKNNVTTVAPRDAEGTAAMVWLRARDDFEGELRDLVDALEYRRVGPREFDREKARLLIAIRRAEHRFELERRRLKQLKSARSRRR